MSKCKAEWIKKGVVITCGARWRTNYPFGQRSKGLSVMIMEHHQDCPHKRKTWRNEK